MPISRKSPNKALRVILCSILFLVGIWMPLSTPQVFAASCYGSGCTGYNPNTMGCGADAKTGPTYSASGVLVENRYSVTCNAEWERTTNQSGGSRYAAGSIRYGCANYCYSQNVSSPAPIANGAQVYTPMVGPDSTIDTLSCGKVSTTGPISTPVTSPCTGVG
jgi:hypothetical protein